MSNIPIGVYIPYTPPQYGIAIEPHVLTNFQDILSNFTREIARIRLLTMSLNRLVENPDTDIVTLKADILLRTSAMVNLHDNLSNLYTRISNILEPRQGQVVRGGKRRKTKRRRFIKRL
jgi:hypothetical protein